MSQHVSKNRANQKNGVKQMNVKSELMKRCGFSATTHPTITHTTTGTNGVRTIFITIMVQTIAIVVTIIITNYMRFMRFFNVEN